MIRALDQLREFPVPTVAGAVLVDGVVADSAGPLDHRFRLASIAKTITAWAILIAVEEGIVTLDDEVGPPPTTGVRTLRHLLTHAGGYGFDGAEPIVSPERNRIYSNTGIEVAADHVSTAAAMPFRDYLQLGLLEPLEMTATELTGSPAHAMWSNVRDLTRFMREVTAPTLISRSTADDAVRPHFASLGGIVPGVGRFDTCPWGMGFEIRGDKSPHWTGTRNSAATYGHFGGAGTMMWLDPAARPDHSLGLVVLTDRSFDEWADEALRRWPAVSDAVIEEFSGAS
jgi:CubicO group peptidase (beta-lactamase class C family)